MTRKKSPRKKRKLLQVLRQNSSCVNECEGIVGCAESVHPIYHVIDKLLYGRV